MGYKGIAGRGCWGPAAARGCRRCPRAWAGCSTPPPPAAAARAGAGGTWSGCTRRSPASRTSWAAAAGARRGPPSLPTWTRRWPCSARRWLAFGSWICHFCVSCTPCTNPFKNIKVPAKLTLMRTARMLWKMAFSMKRRNISRNKKAGLNSLVLLSLHTLSH